MTESPPNIETNPSDTCFIIDKITMIQKANTLKAAIFQEIAESLASSIETAFRYANHVNVVPDWYDSDDSIKSFEQKRRKTMIFVERKINGVV